MSQRRLSNLKINFLAVDQGVISEVNGKPNVALDDQIGM